MERLIDNALRFGGLMEISQPHQVERYNNALEGLGLPRTGCTRFSIDATGFSPEVAEDLGNRQYLDPNGVNRRFIILSPSQGELPVVSINFSSTTEIVKAFFRRNAEALQLLTLKDAVYGEIENSTYRIDDLDDVLSIKQVEFKLSTVNALLDKAGQLQDLIERFHREEDAWMDDDLLEEILELGKVCGDVRHNKLVPRHRQFEQRSFWTRHFDGIYVLHEDNGETVVIGGDHLPDIARVPDRCLSFSDTDDVYRYLWQTGRLEPFNPDWLTASRVLEHRMDYYVRHAVTHLEPDRDLIKLDNMWISNWVRDHLDDISHDGAFNFLSRVRKIAANGGHYDFDDVPADHRFLAVRAKPGHPDSALVNRLISEYIPFDFVTRFIVNKERFYKDYPDYPDAYRDYIVHTITSTFFPDKESFWRRMFE